MSVDEEELQGFADWPGPGVSNPRDTTAEIEEQERIAQDVRNASQQEIGQGLSIIAQVLEMMRTDGWGIVENWANVRSAERVNRLATGDKAQTLEEIQTLRGELRSLAWLLSLKSDMTRQQQVYAARQDELNAEEAEE